MKCNQCNQIIPDDSAFCPLCGSAVHRIEDNKTDLSSGKKSITKETAIALIVLLVILCSAIIGLLSTVSQTRQEYAQVSEKYNQLSKQYNDLKSENQKNKATAKKYNDAVNYLTAESNLNFSASNYIFTLQSNSTETFRLTTKFDKEFWITFDKEGHSADLEFLESNWSQSTMMKITAKTEGVTWFRFKNNVDSKEFSIIVIVTG